MIKKLLEWSIHIGLALTVISSVVLVNFPSPSNKVEAGETTTLYAIRLSIRSSSGEELWDRLWPSYDFLYNDHTIILNRLGGDYVKVQNTILKHLKAQNREELFVSKATCEWRASSILQRLRRDGFEIMLFKCVTVTISG